MAPLAAIWAMLTNLIPQVGGLLGGSFFVLLAVTQGPAVGVAALAWSLLSEDPEAVVAQARTIEADQGHSVRLSVRGLDLRHPL